MSTCNVSHIKMTTYKRRTHRLSFGSLICLCISMVGCGGGSGGVSAASTLNMGLIHEWKFDGDPNDSIGTLNGTAVGPVTYVKGMIGQAIVLNGSTTGVNVPAAPDMQFQKSFSITAWASLFSYPDPSQGASSIIFDGDDRNGLDPYTLMVLPSGNLQFSVDGAAQPNGGIDIWGKMPLNKFVCIAATYDQKSGALRLYKNGILTGENLFNSALTPVVPLDPASNPGVGIGTNNSFPNSYVNYGFNGAINDLRVYNRALTRSEVQALYREGLAGR